MSVKGVIHIGSNNIDMLNLYNSININNIIWIDDYNRTKITNINNYNALITDKDDIGYIFNIINI